MLSEFEFQHVEAFPSILRLLSAGQIVQELINCIDNLHALKKITFHRVLDNEIIFMDADNFWIHLNFQLMHLLDFLPVACWGVNWDEPLMQVFLELFSLLKKADRVQANVLDVQIDPEARLDGQPTRLLDTAVRYVPSRVKRHLASKSIADFSKAIGHSLKYELQFKE